MSLGVNFASILYYCEHRCGHINMQASNKPLIAASSAGYEAMVQLLLDKGADINIMDQVGFYKRM